MIKVKNNIAVSEAGFVFNPSTGDSFTLNETGRQVINMLNDGKNIDEIKNTLKNSYEVDELTLEHYLLDFVNDLQINKIIE